MPTAGRCCDPPNTHVGEVEWQARRLLEQDYVQEREGTILMFLILCFEIKPFLSFLPSLVPQPKRLTYVRGYFSSEVNIWT
jgi:hypothetical protein